MIKAVGPVALGGRELPLWFSSLVVLLAPALLAAGVAAGGLVFWRTESIIACVLTSAVLTAALRGWIVVENQPMPDYTHINLNDVENQQGWWQD